MDKNIDMDKEKDLEHDKRKEVLNEIIEKIAEENPKYYYMPTVEIAEHIHEFIKERKDFPQDKLSLVEHLSTHDIQILIAHHEGKGKI